MICMDPVFHFTVLHFDFFGDGPEDPKTQPFSRDHRISGWVYGTGSNAATDQIILAVLAAKFWRILHNASRKCVPFTQL